MNRIIALLAAMIAGLWMSAPAAAVVAPNYSYFSFKGTCRDCDGYGLGTLKLQNYTVGTSLTSSNFVEFTYSSNLLPSIDLKQVSSLNGSLSSLPGANDVNFYDGVSNFAFISVSSGSWCDGNSCLADDGPTHIWSIASGSSAAPEPAAWAMMVIGFGTVGIAIRRRQRIAVRFA